MTINDILKNKFITTALAASLFILILVLLLSPKKSPPSTPIEAHKSEVGQPELINLSQAKRNAAMVYTASIEKKFPLALDSFETSVGIITSIRISRSDFDPAEIVHLDINGLSYISKNELDEKKNPNVTAFKESYLKAIEMLESQNIDPKKLIFVYSDKPYVRETTQAWIDVLKLRP